MNLTLAVVITYNRVRLLYYYKVILSLQGITVILHFLLMFSSTIWNTSPRQLKTDDYKGAYGVYSKATEIDPE